MLRSVIISSFAALCCISCNNTTQNGGNTLAASRETISIYVDRPLESVINQQKLCFENMYTMPAISITSRDENQLLNALLMDSVRCAILSRPLTDAETARLTQINEIEPKQYTIAYDGLALLVNRKFPADTISLDQLKQILSDKTAKTPLVFESSSSGSVSFLFRQLGLTPKADGGNTYAQKSHEELAAYLRSSDNAIGCLPFSYISEIDAPYTREYLRDLKVLAVKYHDSTGAVKAFEPAQETIATREYPLYKPVVLVYGNLKEHSGTVFVNFILKPRAQRIFLKSGLVPAIFPGREININTSSINETEE